MALARTLSQFHPGVRTVVYLRGDLGTGKTTLVRALLRQCGVTGPIRSPTYTLLEPYEAAGEAVYHLDLYRLQSPEELEFIGIRDLLGQSAMWLIEWPEQGDGVAPAADLELLMCHQGDGRQIVMRACSEHGDAILKAVALP